MNNCILSSNSKPGNHSLKGTVSHKKEKFRSVVLLSANIFPFIFVEKSKELESLEEKENK